MLTLNSETSHTVAQRSDITSHDLAILILKNFSLRGNIFVTYPHAYPLYLKILAALRLCMCPNGNIFVNQISLVSINRRLPELNVTIIMEFSSDHPYSINSNIYYTSKIELAMDMLERVFIRNTTRPQLVTPKA